MAKLKLRSRVAGTMIAPVRSSMVVFKPRSIWRSRLASARDFPRMLLEEQRVRGFRAIARFLREFDRAAAIAPSLRCLSRYPRSSPLVHYNPDRCGYQNTARPPGERVELRSSVRPPPFHEWDAASRVRCSHGGYSLVHRRIDNANPATTDSVELPDKVKAEFLCRRTRTLDEACWRAANSMGCWRSLSRPSLTRARLA